ncbi:MAG: hypothetical protein M5U26_26505 [Planctomycetota bacterium]|nr:hypothetical protein [Planctomycetota bacterium]
MQIIFCDLCGKRIQDEQPQPAAEEKSYCVECNQKRTQTMPTAPLSPSAAGLMPPPRTGVAEAVGKRTGAQTTTRKGVRATPVAAGASVRGAHAAEGPSPGKLIALGAGALVLLIGGFLIFAGGSPSSTQHTARATDASKQLDLSSGSASNTNLTTPVRSEPGGERKVEFKKPAPAVTAPTEALETSKPAETANAGIGDIREQYARKQLDEIRKAFDEGKEHAYYVRQRLEQFVQGNGSTKAGQDGAKLLAQTPEVEPPPPPKELVVVKEPAQEPGATATPELGAAKVLFAVTQDRAEDETCYRNGEKDTTEVYSGKLFSWKAKKIENPTWFSSSVSINFKDHPAVTDQSWMQVAVKLDGASNLCFHSGYSGGAIFEKHVTGQPQGKWFWVTIKMSDFTRDIKKGPNSHPVAGMTCSGTTIYAGTKGLPCTLWLGPVIFGDGPVPATP